MFIVNPTPDKHEEELLDLAAPIRFDPYFTFGRGPAVMGRVVDLRASPDGAHLVLRSPDGDRRFLIRFPDTPGVAEVRPGDHIALVVESTSITAFAILSRAERATPDAADWGSPENETTRLRQREVDLLVRPSARRMVEQRSAILFGIRQHLQQLGFIELELPVLKRHPDVAPAQHFEVVDNNGRHLYLRTTFPPFERMFVSLDRAYTIGPNFRNGDWSHKNIPEFTMLCLMMRGATYLDAHRLVRAMMATVVADVMGTSIVTFRGQQFNLRSWEEVSLVQEVRARLGVELAELDDDKEMTRFASRHGITSPASSPGGHLMRAALFDRLFEALIVPAFPGPTFFTDVPWYLAGPAEPHPSMPGIKLRGEGYVAGMELTNAKNILTDLDALRRWHERIAQEKRSAGFKEEYAAVDKDYLRSIEYGLHPGALSSIGIDRLVMLALGVDHISEAVMYPVP